MPRDSEGKHNGRLWLWTEFLVVGVLLEVGFLLLRLLVRESERIAAFFGAIIGYQDRLKPLHVTCQCGPQPCHSRFATALGPS